MSGASTTIVITRQVRAGCEADFEALLRTWIPRLVQFPGHEGALILQPLPPAREYGAVLKFASQSAWEAFQQWDQYALFLEQLKPLLEEEPRTEHLTGMEAWFRWGRTHRQPARWKMAIVTWVGVCLTVGVLGQTLGPRIENWPWLGNLLLINAAVVVVLTWAVMPALTRLVGSWLQPST